MKNNNYSPNSSVITTIKDIALSVTGSFDLDTLLQSIIETCTRYSNASRGALFLVNDETRELVMRAEKGNAPELRFNARYSIDVDPDENKIGLTLYIFLKKKTLVLNSPEEIVNHKAHKGKFDEKQYPGKQKCQSLVGIPLIKNNNAIGVLKIENTIDRKPITKFSDDEIEVFKLIADIASSSIIKFQYQLSKINSSINRLSDALKGAGLLHRKLREIVSTFKEISNAEGASIWLIKGEKLICKGGVGHYEAMEEQASYSLSFNMRDAKKVGLTAWIARSGEMINIKSNPELISHPQHKGTYDSQNYPDPSKKKCRSFIGAPLKIGDTIIGVIKADNRIPDEEHPESYFTEEEAQIFSYLAIITAIVVENDQEFEKIRTHDKQLITLYKLGTECSNLKTSDEIFRYLLTGLTHNDGLRFNRSILFDYYKEEKPYLVGRDAVGPLNIDEGKQIQEDLDCGKILTDLERYKEKLVRNEPLFPQPKLQSFIQNKKINLSEDGILFEEAQKKNHPRVTKISFNEFCDKFKKFLGDIQSNITNRQILIFSLYDTDNHLVFGLCDNVYSSQNIDTFILNATETFVNQISLAVSRIELKKTEEETRERAWREFSVTTAHRIGTETADMEGAFHWLKKTLTTKDPSESSKYFKRIDLSLERMKYAVKEYTELTRPPQVNMEKIDINTLLSEVALLHKEIVEIERKLSKNIYHIYGDYERLHYAFRELTHNAIRAMDKKGKLTIYSSYDKEKKMVIIKFEDNGPGVDPKYFDKIFERGFKGRKGGTGLGLFIVKKTILEHKGKIEVRNNQKNGADFIVYLPIEKEKPSEINHILIVDDNDNLRDDIKKLVKDIYPNIKAYEAKNEYEAADFINDINFDYVIADISLDEGGGTQFGGIRIVEFIKKHSRQTKIIIFTSHQALIYKNGSDQGKQALAKAKELGADYCLPRVQYGKPFLEKLEEILK